MIKSNIGETELEGAAEAIISDYVVITAALKRFLMEENGLKPSAVDSAMFQFFTMGISDEVVKKGIPQE